MPDPNINDLLNLLRWDDQAHFAEKMFGTWLDAVSSQLGIVLGVIVNQDSLTGEPLLHRARGLSDTSMVRLLTSPAASDRLLWPERHNLRETAGWLMNALDMESTETADSALHRIGAVIPVDWDSPAAQAIDQSYPASRDRLWESLTESEKKDVLQQTNAAFGAIGEVSPEAQTFVIRFTRVLMLQKHSGVGFRTRSPERRIGLSLFENPQLPTTDEVDLAEGLVHEAIHSLLDVDERVRQLTCAPEDHWVRDPKLYDGISRVVSPWTGTPLALPTFLHASYVWYGLLHYWCAALPASVFDHNRVKARIAQSAGGFLGPSLIGLLSDYKRSIGLHTLDALQQMQQDVVASFRGSEAQGVETNMTLHSSE
jgi:hypothetical protein